MEIDEEDLHVCLTCHMTISGLENYIHHKKHVCSSAKKVHAEIHEFRTLAASSATSIAEDVVKMRNPRMSVHGLTQVTSKIHIQPVPELHHNSETLVVSETGVPTAGLFPGASQQHVGMQLLGGALNGQSVERYAPQSDEQNSPVARLSHGVAAQHQSSPVLPDAESSHTTTQVTQPLDTDKSAKSHSPGPRRGVARVKKRGPQNKYRQSSSTVNSTTTIDTDVVESLSSPQGDSDVVPSTAPKVTAQESSAGGDLPEMDDDAIEDDNADALQEVSESEMANLVSSFSPNVNRTIDANMMLYTNVPKDPAFSSVSDFFSSLELQAKWNFDRSEKDEDDDRLDHQKALRIANILNELAFSSDSDDFFPADAENLLNMDEEDFDVAIKQEPTDRRSTQRSSPRQAGKGKAGRRLPPGGKWKPGKLETEGKWKPSRKLAAMKANAQAASRRTLRSRGKVPPSADAWGGAEYESDYDADTDVDDTETHDSKHRTASSGKATSDSSHHAGKKMNIIIDSGGDEIIVSKITGPKSAKATGDPDLDRVLEIAVKVEKDDEFQTDSDVDQNKNEIELEPTKPVRIPHRHVKSSFEEFADESLQPDGTYHCKTCNRTIKSSRVGFERHCATTYHTKREGLQELGMKIDNKIMRSNEMEPIECRICNRFFNYKYNFARHLASDAHLSRAQNCEAKLLLDESVQVLLLRQSHFQCLVCSFFTSQFEYLQQHMTAQQHCDKSQQLVGPLLCVRCHYACRSNDEMITHLSSDDHKRTVEASKRPTIIKESRTRVKCEKCEQIVHSASALVKHMKACHPANKPDQPLRKKGVRTRPVCPYCRTSWPSSFAMAVHVRRKHTRVCPFKCTHCGKEFVDKHSLKIHSESAGHINQLIRASQKDKPSGIALATKKRRDDPLSRKPLFKCKHCDTCVNKYTDLREHYLTEHASKMIRCEPCGLSFHSMTLYNDHTLRKGHKMRTDFIQKRVKTYPCSICGRVFNNTKKMELHELSHRVVLTESAGRKLVGDPFFGIHERYHDFLRSIQVLPHSDRVACPECHKTMCRSNIYPHMRSHDGEAPYQCIICLKRFYNSSTLRHHMEVHLEMKEFKCSFCPKAFYRKHRLRDHVLASHTPNAERKWMCQMCGMAFTSKNTARAHERGHERRFKCPYEKCRYAFRSRLDLESHIRTHTNERPFLCDQCGYAAKTKRQLGYHRKRHTGERNYHCDYCEYRATTKAHLQRHMRIHIGVKPYKCPYCEFACNTLDNLTKHILKTKRHAGLPVYPCKSCTFGANTGKEFREHLYEAHGIENRDVGVLATYMGIYKESLDAKVMPEGALVIPIKERKPRIKKESEDGELLAPPKKKKKARAMVETQHVHESMLDIQHDAQVLTEAPPVIDGVADVKIDFGPDSEKQVFYHVQKHEDPSNSEEVGTVTIWSPEEIEPETIAGQRIHELSSPVAQHVEIIEQAAYEHGADQVEHQLIEHHPVTLAQSHAIDNQVVSHQLVSHAGQQLSRQNEAELEENRQNVEQFIGLVEQTFGHSKVGEVVQSAVWSQQDQQMYVVCGQDVEHIESMAGTSDHVYHTIEVEGTSDVQVVEVAISTM